MNKAIAIVAAAAAVTAAPQLMFANNNLDLSSGLDMTLQGEDLFMAWSKKFGKTYSHQEGEKKLANFMNNAALINSHNAQYEKGLQSFTMALNQFSDLSADEFQTNHLQEYKPTRARKEVFLDTSNLSANADWRKKGAVTPIKNQGQCGSCWAFSTTGSTEGAWQIAGHNITSLSEQQLMDCDKKDNSCQGGFYDYAFEYIEKNGGIGTEAGYPYVARNEPCQHAKEKEVATRLSAFHDVPHGSDAQLQAAVEVGPVSVAIDAKNNAFMNYHSGIYSGPCGTALDHAVLIVGFTKDYWIVKNSWGTTWGDEGYVHFSRTGNLCGIQNAASYPIAKKGPLPPTSPPSPAPPTISPTNGAPSKWKTIVQNVFKGPKKCNGTPQDTLIPVGKCENDGHGSFKMSCSADGTKFTQTQYSDTACTSQTQVVPGQTAKCYNAGPLTYLEFVCQTSTDNVEIAQN